MQFKEKRGENSNFDYMKYAIILITKQLTKFFLFFDL